MATLKINEAVEVELSVADIPSMELASALVGRALTAHIAENRADLLAWLFSHPAFSDYRIVES